MKLIDVDTKSFSIIFEKSWQSSEVPEDWKKGRFVPSFKTSRKDDPGNK